MMALLVIPSEVRNLGFLGAAKSLDSMSPRSSE